MKVCAWMLFGALLGPTAWPQEPAPPSVPAKAESTDDEAHGKTPDKNLGVLDAETSRLLRQFIAQREQATAAD